MSDLTGRLPGAVPGVLNQELSVGKQLLAFDALSKLNQQIADNPDFYTLINLLLLTLSGQFSSPNCFAAIRNPRRVFEQPLFFTTGTYERSEVLMDEDMSHFYREYFGQTSAPLLVDEAETDIRWTQCVVVLREHKVKVVAPLTKDDKVIGVIGMGEKVSRKTYGPADLQTLTLLVNAIAPFMANLSMEYFDLFNSVRQGVLIFDRQDLLTRVNATGLRILERFGTDRQDPSSVYKTALEGVFPEPAFDGWAAQIRQAKSQPPGALITGLIAKADDIERVYTARISAINRRSDSQADLLVILDDVTEQKASEQRMYDLQKFAEKGLMASSIAHELNNYLAMILGGVEIAQRHLERSNAHKADGSIEKVKVHIGMMQRFTAGLTNFAKLESKKAIAGLGKVVTDVLSFIKVQKRFKRIHIDAELDRALPPFEFDSDQMAQLLLNILHNAADAIASAEPDEGRIQITTSRSGDDICLAVSDNGGGIRPEVKSKLFKYHLTTKETGHGFGLVTCAKILDDHGATVDIESEPGQGTTFTFRFPLRTSGPVQSQEESES